MVAFLNILFQIIKYFINILGKVLKYLTGFFIVVLFWKFMKKSRAEDNF